MARAEGIPLVVVLSSTGADIVEGIASLEGWGRVAKALVDCSGVVPTILVVDGPAVAGPALLLGIADLVVMTAEQLRLRQRPGDGRRVHRACRSPRTSSAVRPTSTATAGVASLVVADRPAAEAAAIELLGYLPSSADEEPGRWGCSRSGRPELPGDRRGCSRPPPPGATTSATSPACIVDEGSLLELRERWAPNVVTALATIGGRPIGVVANQPLALAGTLDIAASQKAARFVSFCDAFNLGILTLVDTPGFYPGKDLEWRGMIRHGAQLVFAYARATVPRLCVILRKSYGGAYIVMDSKRMGNDVCFAWPSAELAVMGAGQAAAILRRRATPEERAAFEADYAERLLNPYVAAERGYVDAVIDPAETRAAVAAAFDGAGRQARAVAAAQARQRTVLNTREPSPAARDDRDQLRWHREYSADWGGSP